MLLFPHAQRELTRVRMTQTLRGDLTSSQEAGLIDLLAEKVSDDQALHFSVCVQGDTECSIWSYGL